MDRETRKKLIEHLSDARLTRLSEGRSFAPEDLAADAVASHPEVWKSARHDAAMDWLVRLARTEIRGSFHLDGDERQYPLFTDFERVSKAVPLVKVGKEYVPLPKLTAEPVVALAKKLEAELETARARAEREAERDFKDREGVVKETNKLARLIVRYNKTAEGITVEEVLRRREERRKAREERRKREMRRTKTQ